MHLSVKCKARRRGEQSDASGLFVSAWYELPELRRRPLKKFLADSLAYLDDDRWEILVYHDDVAVGGVICVRNLDPHVGDSLLVLYQYVAPGYRSMAVSKACMRASKALCQRIGLPVLAFTHRLSAREYRTTYYEVRDGAHRKKEETSDGP